MLIDSMHRYNEFHRMVANKIVPWVRGGQNPMAGTVMEDTPKIHVLMGIATAFYGDEIIRTFDDKMAADCVYDARIDIDLSCVNNCRIIVDIMDIIKRRKSYEFISISQIKWKFNSLRIYTDQKDDVDQARANEETKKLESYASLCGIERTSMNTYIGAMSRALGAKYLADNPHMKFHIQYALPLSLGFSPLCMVNDEDIKESFESNLGKLMHERSMGPFEYESAIDEIGMSALDILMKDVQ